jgi:hypothetical protein
LSDVVFKFQNCIIYTIQDLRKEMLSCLVWFLLTSQIGEFFLPHPACYFYLPDESDQLQRVAAYWDWLIIGGVEAKLNFGAHLLSK